MSDYEYKKFISKVVMCTLIGLACFVLMPLWMPILAGALVVFCFFLVGSVIVDVAEMCRENLKNKDKY